MSISGIQGQLLEVTVVCCNKLEDTEWISRQDPYVCLDYGGTRFRTRTCTDGGINPTFQEKFVFTLIEGLREIHVSVYNSNTLRADNFIGSGRIQLQKVLSQNYDDSSWSLYGNKGRSSGEVHLIMHYSKPAKDEVSPAPSHSRLQAPHAPLYVTPPYAAPPLVPYPQTSYPAPPVYSSYPPYSTGYPPAPYPPTAYPPAYPPAAYPAKDNVSPGPSYTGMPTQQAPHYVAPPYTYPQTGYPSAPYPPTVYPPTYPPASHPTYPPPPQDPNYYPPGSFPYPQPQC